MSKNQAAYREGQWTGIGVVLITVGVLDSLREWSLGGVISGFIVGGFCLWRAWIWSRQSDGPTECRPPEVHMLREGKLMRWDRQQQGWAPDGS